MVVCDFSPSAWWLPGTTPGWSHIYSPERFLGRVPVNSMVLLLPWRLHLVHGRLAPCSALSGKAADAPFSPPSLSDLPRKRENFSLSSKSSEHSGMSQRLLPKSFRHYVSHLKLFSLNWRWGDAISPVLCGEIVEWGGINNNTELITQLILNK